MKSAETTHAHNGEPPARAHPTPAGTTLTQGIGPRLLIATPALVLLWLLVAWALQ